MHYNYNCSYNNNYLYFYYYIYGGPVKKGFVVYFDNCRQVEHLSDRTYAAVWRTVTEYARRLAEGDGAEEWLAQHLAELPGDAAMAARFMTDNARRDDDVYRSRIEQRRAKQEQTRPRGETGSARGDRDDFESKKRRALSALYSSRESKAFGEW